MKVAVIGYGSIGKRHAANLRALGCEVLTVDVNGEADYEDVSALPTVDAVVICVPARAHLSSVAALADYPALVEKPVGMDAFEAFAIGSARGMVWQHGAWGLSLIQVGYNLRQIPALRIIRERITQNVGKILWARIEFGQVLTTWRPGRDYRSTPAAEGVLLEASHEIDLALWLFGPVRRVIGATLRQMVFDVREDFASAILEMESGAIIELHLDMTSPGYTRRVTVAGTRDVLICEPFGNGQAPDKDVVDAMYLDEMRAFLHCVETGEKPVVGVEEAIAVHKVIAMIREAAAPNLPPEVEGMFLGRSWMPRL